MAWETSDRRSRLPSDWQARRLKVLRRARYMCQGRDAAGVRCGDRANQVDHIVPGDDHSLSNLQALCEPCHKEKTQREAAAGRARLSRKRPPRKHPGQIDL